MGRVVQSKYSDHSKHQVLSTSKMTMDLNKSRWQNEKWNRLYHSKKTIQKFDHQSKKLSRSWL